MAQTKARRHAYAEPDGKPINEKEAREALSKLLAVPTDHKVVVVPENLPLKERLAIVNRPLPDAPAKEKMRWYRYPEELLNDGYDPKVTKADAVELCKPLVPVAINTLRACMAPEAPHNVRVVAATTVLRFATTEHTPVEQKPISDLTLAEIDEQIEEATSRLKHLKAIPAESTVERVAEPEDPEIDKDDEQSIIDEEKDAGP